MCLSRVSGHTVHLATSKHTHVSMLTNTVNQHCSSLIRSIVPVAELSRPDFRPMFNEVDVVVRVIKVHESPDRMTVEVMDSSQKIASIVVWGSSNAR